MKNCLSEEIVRNVTARQVAERYGFAPNRAGYIRCPFHREKTASLKLYDGDRGWHCFGCGRGGDVVHFVMALFGINWTSAVFRMNEDFNLRLPIQGARRPRYFLSPAERKRRERAKKLTNVEQRRDELALHHCFWARETALRKPKRTEGVFPYDPLYCEALERLTELDGLLEELDREAEELKG